MKVLFCNIPNLQYIEGQLHSGSNAGSRWPYTVPGFNMLVPFPFFLSWAASYLREHGIDAEIYDGVASRHFTYDLTRKEIQEAKPEILVIEVATQTVNRALEIARWAKDAIGCKVVITGAHMAAYGDNVLAENAFVDHVVVGEFDLASLKIAQGSTQRKFTFDHVSDINNVNGHNWTPYRDMRVLHNYLDPSMIHTPVQLQVNGSRGCPWRCSYCSFPVTMFNKYRVRAAENIIDEIQQVIDAYKAAPALADGSRRQVGSIFFDDETWNVGENQRMKDICDGLKRIGIPWSFIGRIDTSSREMFERFVDSGCVGMRFGVETFHQHLLDSVNKKLDAKVSWGNLHWMLTRFKGIHIRMLTMRMLPGETEAEEREDLDKFHELQRIGESHGNRVDLQISDCVPMPGTAMWKEMTDEQKAERKFEDYQAMPDHPSEVARRLKVYAKE